MSRKYLEETDTKLPFVYAINHVLRRVVPCKMIAEVYGKISVNSWLIKNSFKRVYCLTSHQILSVDLSSLMSLSPEMLIGLDPCFGLDVDGIEKFLELCDRCTLGAAVAIPTRDSHVIRPKLLYTDREWIDIFSQVGSPLVTMRCDYWSFFLVLK